MRFLQRKTRTTQYTSALKLGAMAGMRTMAAVSTLQQHLANPDTATDPRLDVLKSPMVNTALKMAAAGEIIADKMPFIGSRTAPLPLLWRIGWGATLGASTAIDQPRDVMVRHALIGAAAALLSSVVMARLRTQISKDAGVPDVLLGMAEDGMVGMMGNNIARDMNS